LPLRALPISDDDPQADPDPIPNPNPHPDPAPSRDIHPHQPHRPGPQLIAKAATITALPTRR